jgi:hypothetical protein
MFHCFAKRFAISPFRETFRFAFFTKHRNAKHMKLLARRPQFLLVLQFCETEINCFDKNPCLVVWSQPQSLYFPDSRNVPYYAFTRKPQSLFSWLAKCSILCFYAKRFVRRMRNKRKISRNTARFTVLRDINTPFRHNPTFWKECRYPSCFVLLPDFLFGTSNWGSLFTVSLDLTLLPP